MTTPLHAIPPSKLGKAGGGRERHMAAKGCRSKNVSMFFSNSIANRKGFLPCLSPFRAWTGGGTAGAHHDAGLPDIGGFMSGILLAVNPDSGGALTLTAGIADRQTADGPINSWGYVDFKASKSNPRYGVSDTVMPPSVNLPVILYLGIPA